MGRPKTNKEFKVAMSFKVKPETRKKFNKIVKFCLLTTNFSVLEAFVEEVVEKWENEIGQKELISKYFKLND